MFWPAKIHHVVLVFPRERKHELVLSLHEEGVCQLADSKIELECLRKEGIDEVQELDIRLKDIISFLENFREPVPPENFVKSLFFPSEQDKTIIELRENEEIIRDVREKLNALEQLVKDKRDELTKVDGQISEIKSKIRTLALLPDIPTNLFTPTKNLNVLCGLVVSETLPTLSRTLSGKPVVCISEQATEEKHFVAVFFPPEEEKDLLQILHNIGFEELEFPKSPKTPRQQIAELRDALINLRQMERKITESLRTVCKEHFKELLILQEEISICRERLQALENMRGGRTFAVMEAWVPEKNFQKFKKIIEKTTKEFYLEVDEKSDAPTLLDNPWFAKPAELLTNLYSLPKYGRLDPTPIIAFSFAFFFGFMLTDAVYGVLTSLLAFGIYRGAGKYSEGMKSFSGLMIAGGLFTTILGALLGSYFGDLLDKLGIFLPRVLNPMTDVVPLIALTAGIGLVHMTLGLILGVTDNLKNNEHKKAMSEQGVWLIFILGVVLAIFSSALNYGDLILPSMGLIVLSILLRMAFVFMESGFVRSMLSIFDFSSFMGDVFSYARLMAMAVGTAGIALAVNFLAFLVWDMISNFSNGLINQMGFSTLAIALWVGLPALFLVVIAICKVLNTSRLVRRVLMVLLIFHLSFLALLTSLTWYFDIGNKAVVTILLAIVPVGTLLIVGHLFNLIMNGLGAFVHSLRLHFLEFFTKFYEGGGKPYHPFYATRKITEVKNK